MSHHNVGVKLSNFVDYFGLLAKTHLTQWLYHGLEKLKIKADTEFTLSSSEFRLLPGSTLPPKSRVEKIKAVGG